MTQETDPLGRSAHEPGSKLDAGKLLPDLVLGGFAPALQAVVQVGTFGAQKYTPDGWKTVPNGEARYREALMRHWTQEKLGEKVDPDSGLLHLAHQAWNILAALSLKLQAEPIPEPPWYPDVGNPHYGPWIEHDLTYGRPKDLTRDCLVQTLTAVERDGREFDPTYLLPSQISWRGHAIIAYRVYRDE